MEKKLGKIQHANFGFGGYQDAMIGVNLTLGGDGWGVGDFFGQWACDRSDHAKWTEEQRLKGLGEDVMRLVGILEDAEVRSVDKLVGIPVEITFEGFKMLSWRVLKEVL